MTDIPPADRDMVEAFREARWISDHQRDDDPNRKPINQIIGEAFERHGLWVCRIEEVSALRARAAADDQPSPKFAEGWQAAIAAVRVGAGTLDRPTGIEPILDTLASEGPRDAGDDAARLDPDAATFYRQATDRNLPTTNLAATDGSADGSADETAVEG